MVHVASSVVYQQSRFTGFLVCRDSTEIFPDGGAEKMKAVGVPPAFGAFSSIGGGTCCTGQFLLFSGISVCAIDGETKFWANVLPPFAWKYLVWALRLPLSLRSAVPGYGVWSNSV